MGSTALEKLLDLMAQLRNDKPNDRSDLDRQYAVILTDLEKVEAYYYHYILTE